MVQDMEVYAYPRHHHHNYQRNSDLNRNSPKSVEPNGISELIEFQTRISSLENLIVKDIKTSARRESSKSTKVVTEELKSIEAQKHNKSEKFCGKRYLTLDNLNLTKPKPEISEARKGVPIRDIPLDQASDGSSSANSRSQSRRGYLRNDDIMIKQSQLPYDPQIEDLQVVPNQESRKGKILNKLASDAEKLANLEQTVNDLTKRLETGKKSRKAAGVDFETVKEQLVEAEETILQLVNVNVESAASIEKNPSLAVWVEHDDTWKTCEKIKRVQLEVQKIQYVLLKLDDEKKSKTKSRFLRTKSRTSVILRDFVHRGKTCSSSSRRRRLCGCFTPSGIKTDRLKI